MKSFLLMGLMLVSFVTVGFGQEQPGMAQGAQAPDFQALNYLGEKVKLSNFLKQGPVVLVFYRGGWCPFCNTQLQQLQASLENFKKYNASLVAVSVDKISKAAATVKNKSLDFEVISNPEGDILEAYGLMYTVPDELNTKYKEKYGIDLEAASGRTDHMIAIPATYVIDTNGKIIFAYANENYKVRASIEDVLAALEKGANPYFSKIEIKTTHVAGTVYMLEGMGGNIGVSVGEDGVLMIDDQFEPLHDKIKAAVEKLNPSDVRFILNTHWHGDHTGGNELFNKEGATIIAHENVRKRLSTQQVRKLFDKVDEAKPKGFWPVITFEDSIAIHFNDECIDVIHFPIGHTDGDSVVYFRDSNVIHTGDHFFNGSFPFIDLDSGGDVEGYIQNVKKLINEINNDTKIIPGHGPLGSKKDLEIFLDMLEEATNLVKTAIKKGKTLKEIQENTLSEAVINKWGNGFMSKDKWLSILYENYL